MAFWVCAAIIAKQQMKSTAIKILTLAVAAVWCAACSTTRRLPEGELLYTGLKGVDYVYPSDTTEKVPPALRSEISTAVYAIPNNYWKLLNWRYPFPLGLWVYNNWPDPPSGLRHWLYNKFVEEPVLVSEVRPHVRAHMIEESLRNSGFFRATATYELVHPRNRKKASVLYTVHPGRPFAIDTVEYTGDTSRMGRMIDSIARRDPYLRAGSRYDIDSLAVARTRIANSMRNHGYFYFRPDYVEYLADSVMTPGAVALRVTLPSNVPQFASKPYKTGSVTMIVNRNRGRQIPDTVELDRGIRLIQMMPSNFRRQIAEESVMFKPGATMTVRGMDFTQALLSRLGIFRTISIDAVPDTTAAEPTLNVTVNTTLDAPWQASAEMNIASKSNSYLGPGMSLAVTNTNIFGGGEQLGVALNGSYEWQTGSSRSSVFNSYEAGITATLSVPRLLAPKFIPRNRLNMNWTRFQLNADLLNRPHFFKMAQFNASVNYDWRFRSYVSQTITPFKLTYTKLINTTAGFDSVMAQNPALALSFQNQFIPQIIYNYNYDRTFPSGDNLNWTFSLQEAGNVFWSIYELCGVRGRKTLFGTPFSQFVKGSAQIVYNKVVGQSRYLVGRIGAGAAHAYGNSSEVPYAEQFYVGGANSVRAFTVRSIGPGSYRAPGHTARDYFDQTGTFKFEANLEYRFPIAGPLNGAVFFDSGNVWLLHKDPARPGGLLKADTFFRDLATGTGAGLRFDISMLVVRADLGIGIHAPYDTGVSGYYNMPSFKKSLAFHLAIGYPF